MRTDDDTDAAAVVPLTLSRAELDLALADGEDVDVLLDVMREDGHVERLRARAAADDVRRLLDAAEADADPTLLLDARQLVDALTGEVEGHSLRRGAAIVTAVLATSALTGAAAQARPLAIQPSAAPAVQLQVERPSSMGFDARAAAQRAAYEAEDVTVAPPSSVGFDARAAAQRAAYEAEAEAATGVDQTSASLPPAEAAALAVERARGGPAAARIPARAPTEVSGPSSTATELAAAAAIAAAAGLSVAAAGIASSRRQRPA